MLELRVELADCINKIDPLQRTWYFALFEDEHEKKREENIGYRRCRREIVKCALPRYRY